MKHYLVESIGRDAYAVSECLTAKTCSRDFEGTLADCYAFIQLKLMMEGNIKLESNIDKP